MADCTTRKPGRGAARYAAFAAGAALMALAGLPAPSHAAGDDFNDYILKAIDELQKGYAGLGYDIRKAYTHDIRYDGGVIKPSSPPKTMCVAAVAEVIVTAINLYTAETMNQQPYQHLPFDGWVRMRPKDIRAHIWVDPKLNAYGTADAAVTFGVGKRVDNFADLKPGSFVNINRNNKSGHATVFIGFLDKNGRDLYPSRRGRSVDPAKIAGFKYYSAQNRNSHGLGYGYAFFSGKDGQSYCPTLPNKQKPDCGVIWSKSQKMLNRGYMLHPKQWSTPRQKLNVRDVLQGLFLQNRSRRGADFPGVSPDLSYEDFTRVLDEQDTMVLNPIFEVEDVQPQDAEP